jgi:hypothetical protein
MISRRRFVETSPRHGGGRPRVNGSREETNSCRLVGTDTSETIDSRVAYQPNRDALAERSIVRVPSDPGLHVVFDPYSVRSARG